MKCLRCGYCCIHLWVIIVDKPELGIVDGNLISKTSGEPCKHLIGKDNGNHTCLIHSKPWYKDTPCFAHTQIEQGDTQCRMGKYLLDKIKVGSA